MRTPLKLACSVAVLLGSVGAPPLSRALAVDVEMLVRLLIPAYMAQNFAVLCGDQDAQFLSNLGDGTALVAAFAEHVKMEVTKGLPESEAKKVRVAAADTAQHVSRQELQLLAEQSPVVPAEAFRKWCDRSAKHFIVEIMSKHRERHDEFERLMEAAKR